MFIAEKDPALLNDLALLVYGQPNVKNKAPLLMLLFEIVPPKQALPNIFQYVRKSFYLRYKVKLILMLKIVMPKIVKLINLENMLNICFRLASVWFFILRLYWLRTKTF